MINLLNGDCLELMQSIPDGSVDLILTDPPYQMTNCEWDSMIPLEPMWLELKRIIKPSSAILLFGSEPFSSKLRVSNLSQYKYDWYWQKNRHSNFMTAKHEPKRMIEQVLVFYDKRPTYNPELIPLKEDTIKRANRAKISTRRPDRGQYNEIANLDYSNKKMGYPKNIIKFNLEQNNQYKKVVFHPTQKPVALMEYLIKTYTNEGETVLDFTMGSGSTGVAAVNTNRKFVGIELDKDYFKIAQERINEALEQVKDNEL